MATTTATTSTENTKDSFYQVFVSADGKTGTFKKIERVTKFGVPTEAKVLDEITATDDRRTVKVPVDFREDGELDFEYVYLDGDVTHKLLQTSFEGAKELTFQIKFMEAPSESREFKGIIAELTTDADDVKKKLRKKGKVTITGDVKKELTT